MPWDDRRAHLVSGLDAGYLQPQLLNDPSHRRMPTLRAKIRIMDALPKELNQMVDDLCRKGDHFATMEQYYDAIEKYGQAWDLLPEPRNQWPAATWILMSAGDAHFRLKEFDEAADLLIDALDYPDGETNPFLLLRAGQCLLELGQLDDAANALELAFRLGGEELFADEDPKYIGFIKTQLKISTGQRPATKGRFNHPLG